MITDYEEYLRSWITDVLSKPEPLLNNLPSCPFAKAALIDNKVKFITSNNYLEDIEILFDKWDHSYDVVVLVCQNNIDPEKFSLDMQEINKKYVPLGFGCLEDHVAVPETLGDIVFNNGKYNLVLCQPLDKLNKASQYLQTKGYYKNWSKDYFDSVVSWRLPKTS